MFFASNQKELNNMPEEETIIQDDTCDCMILNFWSACNYGAILTCYGVQCLMEQLNQNTKVINFVGYPNYVECKDFNLSFAKKFADKYLKLTTQVNDYNDLYKFNNVCNTFITGSDQVFRKACANGVLTQHPQLNWSMFFLDFVRPGKKKLSYSASLGTYEIDDYGSDIEKINYYLSQFDDISVREERGTELLKKYFGIHSVQVVDSIFHIPVETLNNMTKEYKSEEKYIALYTLPYKNKEIWYDNLVKTISEKLNLPVKKFTYDYKTPVEEWLAFIKNSEFVITDSYHCALFSVIFNKPFIQTNNNPKAQSRFESIYKLLDISNRTVHQETKNADYNNLLRPFDWENINKRIEEEKLKAKNWMGNALKKEKTSYINFPNFIESQNKNSENLVYDISMMVNRGKIYREYLKYKFLCLFTFGNKKMYYNELRTKYKLKVKKIRKILDLYQKG